MAGPLVITLDISGLLDEHQDLVRIIEDKTKQAAERLSAMTHAHIIERAQEKLHTRREQFIGSLKLEKIDNDIWAITIPPESVWIDEGIKEGFEMLPGFLNSPKAKNGKNGKYLIIPFKHNKSQKTPIQTALAHEIKGEMDRRGISGQTVRNPDGSPKLGLTHSFNIGQPSTTREAYGMTPQAGRKPWMAHPPSKDASSPLLHGVRVYQRQITGAQGQTSVKQDVMTFRTASEKQSGKWIHPGLEPMNFFTEAQEWAQQQWEEVIFPEILDSLDLV
jgi:hypothetical protein